MGFIFLLFMPETPRFLLSTGKFEEAREVFKWIGKVNGLSESDIKTRLEEIHFEGEPFDENLGNSGAIDYIEAESAAIT